MTELDYRVEALTFPNGARLFVLPLPESPTVALQLAVATGSVHEGEFIGCGLSHFLEHMLFQGTGKYPGHSSSDLVNTLGGDNNAFTSYYQTVYHLSLPAAACNDGLDILAEMAMNPLFPQEKFASEKEVICHERTMWQDNPNGLLVEELFGSVFLRHPARYPIIGYLDKIKTVEREMMASYFTRRYRPHLSAFVAVGPVSAEKIYRFLEKKLADWERGSLEPAVLPTEPGQLHFRETTAYFKDPLHRLAVGVRIPAASHADIPALEVLSGILGENSSSRLVNEIRQKSELAVNIGSSIYPMPGEGVMLFNGITTPAKFGRMREKMFAVLADVQKNGVTEQEVAREKNQQIALTLREMRSGEDLAGQLTQSLANYGQAMNPVKLLDSYRKVTVEEVNRVAASYLNFNVMNAVNLINRPAAGKAAATVKPAEDKITEFKVNDRLQVVAFEKKKLPLTELTIITPGGISFENESNCGASRLLSNTIFLGTERWKEDDLLEFMDDNAIENSASSGLTTNMYTFNVPSDKQEALYEAVLEIFTRPKWTKQAFEREKANLLDHLQSRMLNPLQRAIEVGRQTIYGKHPGGMTLTDNSDTIKAMTKLDIMQYYRQLWYPGQVVIGIGGDFDPEKMQKFLTAFDAAMPWSPNPLPLPPAVDFSGLEPCELAVELPREQCAAVYLIPGCSNVSPDRFAFDILQHSENGLASHLFNRVREDNSLAYSTGMMSSRSFYRGVQAFYAMTTAGKRNEALTLLHAEVKRLAEHGLTKTEFEAAQAAVLLECAGQLESAENALRVLCLLKYYNLPVLSLKDQIALYKNLTLEQVNATLKRYLANVAGISVFAGATADHAV